MKKILEKQTYRQAKKKFDQQARSTKYSYQQECLARVGGGPEVKSLLHATQSICNTISSFGDRSGRQISKGMQLMKKVAQQLRYKQMERSLHNLSEVLRLGRKVRAAEN